MFTRRSAIKWLHWLSFFIIVWFYFVEPESVQQLGAAALATHAGMGVILAVVTAIWFTMFWRKGLAGRAGPKLPGWAKAIYPYAHKFLYIATPLLVLTGALAGFAAPYVIRAFGLFPINPGFGGRSIHEFFVQIHEIAFDILVIAIVAHILFHLWRHFRLKDNALRIMMPKVLHRWL